MSSNSKALSTLIALALAIPGLAQTPDDELFFAAAGRGAGNDASFWTTDLTLMNLGEEDLDIEVTWLARDADNSEAAGFEMPIAAGETLLLEDLIAEVFGAQNASGAIRVEVVEDEDEEKSDHGDDPLLLGFARIFNSSGDTTFGQGLVGQPADAAIVAEGDSAYVIGIVNNADFRSNWFGLNISQDEEDEPIAGEVMIELLDLDGSVLDTKTFEMEAMSPMLMPVSDFASVPNHATSLRFTMLEGAGLFGASMIDRLSNDPTTLLASLPAPSDEPDDFTSDFNLEDCTWSSTGRHSYWIPLDPGYVANYVGEEDGAEIGVRITVLDETKMVDGVETRVLEEYETEDGEVVEISRNYHAMCMETGSIAYFGEDVDDYEDGEIVGHEGAWLAGQDGNRAGLIMPGTVMLGSRYFQEVAPGIAEDRAEHTADDVTVVTDFGTFEDCLEVTETSPLDDGEVSIKYYAEGIGLVWDDGQSLVDVSDPSSD